MPAAPAQLISRRSWIVPQAFRQTSATELARALKKCKTAKGRLTLLQQLATASQQQQANSNRTRAKPVAQGHVQAIQKALKQLAPDVKRLPVGSVQAC
jgi:predicted 2-oxoglutarate/Fe(II)-dependent dioxygenase YbiX